MSLKSGITLLILLAMVFSSISGAEVLAFSPISEENTMTDVQKDPNISKGYIVDVLIRNHNVTVKYEKVGETITNPSVTFTIDGYVDQREGPSLDLGENWNATTNMTPRYNVSKKSHSVEVSAVGKYYSATTYKEYDLEDPDIPATRIQDVEVVETTYSGNPTAAVDIVLENPSPRAYSTHIYAHTLQTPSARSVGTIAANKNTTVTRVHLRENPDEEVEGELRMTTARLDEDRGLRDQVWFRGTADGETEWQRQPYEPVEYRNSEDPYRYDNDDGFFESIGVSPRYAAAGVVLAIGFLIFLFRGRSEW